MRPRSLLFQFFSEGRLGHRAIFSLSILLLASALSWAHWLHPDEEEALRRAAFEERRSEAAIVRELLRRHFWIED